MGKMSINFEKLSGLKLWTSWMSKDILAKLMAEEILPIFISRTISGQEDFAGWSETPVHLQELAPEPNLFWAWRSGPMLTSEFQDKYYHQLHLLDLPRILMRLDLMADISGASGVCLLGYTEDPTEDPRSFLSNYINLSGLLKNEVTEYR